MPTTTIGRPETKTSTTKAKTVVTSAPGGPMALNDARVIQILATEHWSLLASRTLSWNESFSRTSMLLATLSAAVVALALVAQIATFGQAFIAFALVILPFVEVVGLGTFARLGEANGEDVRYIQGMNRIRHAYLEIAPHLEPYLVTSVNDDLGSIFSTYGIAPVSSYSIGRRRLHYAFVTTQGMVGILNAMVAAVFAGLLAVLFGAPAPVAVAAGVLAFATTFALQLLYGVAIYERLRNGLSIHFPPSPEAPEPATTRRGVARPDPSAVHEAG